MYRSLRATGRKINIQIDIVTCDPSSQETVLFQLHFPALLSESTRVAERRDEAIFTWVGTNAIARTDFSASANLCPPDSDQTPTTLSHRYTPDVPAGSSRRGALIARCKCSRRHLSFVRRRGEAECLQFADYVGVACSCYRPCKGTRWRSSLRGTRTGEEEEEEEEQQVVSIRETIRVGLTYKGHMRGCNPIDHSSNHASHLDRLGDPGHSYYHLRTSGWCPAKHINVRQSR
jgi:hypothetical protein